MPDFLHELSTPIVMGILNVTPDSFSDGGRFQRRDVALRQAVAMVNDGAGIIDVGGESTRPGAAAVTVQQELDRVIPVIEALRGQVDVAISIDTSKPAVMRAAVAAGAGLINDVMALTGGGALSTAAALDVPVCLMHMRGEPRTMQQNPQYEDVVGEVFDYLQARIEVCCAAGISPDRILVDPGFGFGKTLEHNLALLRHLDRFTHLGAGVVAGISRKSMLGAITGRDVDRRLAGSLAAALVAVQKGARVLRVHDVAETVDVVRLWRAVEQGA